MALIRLTKFLLLLVLVTSCSNEQKTYYNNGKLRSVYTYDSSGEKQGEEQVYYSSGELMRTSFYKNGVAIDSIVTYNKNATLKSVRFIDKIVADYLKNYENNILVSSGSIDKMNRPTGWWRFYSEGKVIAEEERIIILNKSLQNRIKNYRAGSIDSLNSRLFEVGFPMKIVAGKQYSTRIKFNFDKSESKNLLGKEYYYLITSPQINEDFSNLDRIQPDTLYPTNANEFLIMLGFRNPGKRYFRGIIEKHTMVKQNEKLLIVKSQMFVNEKVTVQ